MSLSATGLSSVPKTNTLFDPESGLITPRFKKQLELVGLVSKPFFPEYDPYHVLNVNELLQTNGCFQKDCDFYKKGGISAFKITSQQAIAFLEDDFQDTESIMPREKTTANAIFLTGVNATMQIRFKALEESLKLGYRYDKIHFIAKSQEDKQNVLDLIDTTYKGLFDGIEVNIIIVDTEMDIFEKGLKMLSDLDSLSDQYVIITSPPFASKVEITASSILKEKTCLGIVSSSIKDWREDMKLYGYDGLFGSFEKDVVARVSSLWNFKARQVHTEMRAYKATKGL